MEKDRKAIVAILSEMLDHPNKYGIFPTSRAFDELERLVETMREEALGWMFAEACITIDAGDDLRLKLVPDIIIRARADLAMPDAVKEQGSGPVVQEESRPPAPAAATCGCLFSDAWRCRGHRNLQGMVACPCPCHRRNWNTR